MLVVTTQAVAGHVVRETLGQCFGVVVRSRGLGGNITASLRSLVGGEINTPSCLRKAVAMRSIALWRTPR